jgi:hypothetical protein
LSAGDDGDGKLGTIQIIDLWIQTLDGRFLILPRYTQPPKELQALLEKTQLALRA